MAVGKARWNFKDNSGQPSSFEINIAELTAGNIATVTPLVGALQTAIEGVTLGKVQTQSILASYDEQSTANASSPQAVRELKWELTLVDSVTGDSERRTLPCPDLTVGQAAEKVVLMDLTAGAGLAFKTALQAVAKSKAGNSVILTKAKLVGRNL